MNAKAKTPKQSASASDVERHPIEFHPGTDEIASCLSFKGWKKATLRRAAINAIRNRHHFATVDPEWQRRPRQPLIFHLRVKDDVQVIYTLEPHAVVVRGYDWEPRNEDDGGLFFCDAAWGPSKEETAAFLKKTFK